MDMTYACLFVFPSGNPAHGTPHTNFLRCNETIFPAPVELYYYKYPAVTVINDVKITSYLSSDLGVNTVNLTDSTYLWGSQNTGH